MKSSISSAPSLPVAGWQTAVTKEAPGAREALLHGAGTETGSGSCAVGRESRAGAEQATESGPGRQKLVLKRRRRRTVWEGGVSRRGVGGGGGEGAEERRAVFCRQE